jgi:hypothetical protein
MEGCLVRKNEELCIIDETTFPAFGGKKLLVFGFETKWFCLF